MAEKLLKLATPQDPLQELIKQKNTASQEELAASQKVTELETKKAQNEAERAATQAKAKETATTELTARQAEREKPIKEEKGSIDKQLMNASFEPSKENLESQVALFSLINVIGFAIGSGGKQNAQQAMSAMNGMLEGHQKGREDVFKQEKVKFDSNFKALQSKATFLENELRHSLEEFTRDKRAADERAAAAFAEAGADFMKTYAEKNGLVAAYERAKEIRKAADKAVTDEQTRQQRIQDKIDAEARAEAQRVIDDRRRLAEREEFAKFAAGLKSLKGQGGLGAKAFLESTLGVTAPDEKTSQKIVDTALGVSQLGHVMTIFKDPEVKAGVMSKLSSIKEKLASLGDNNYEISESELRQIIDGEISPSAKNAVAQKEALFAAYTAEREIAGGRLLVSVVKQAGGALDPTNYEKAGYLNLLGSRREELVKRLRGALMNDEQINTVVQSIEGKAKNDRSFGKAADKKDYSRPANMSDADWAEYKKAHGG